MKKQILVALLATATLASVGCTKDDATNLISAPEATVQGEAGKLPTQARQFVAEYFRGYAASEVKTNAVETENGTLYTSILEKTDDQLRATIILPSRVKIEFDRNGQWREIECLIDGAALPENILGLLPAPIVQYVQRNYAGIGIHEIERKSYGYKVELVNDKELLFDRNGEVLSDNKKGQKPQQPQNNQLDNNVQYFVRTHFPSYKVAYIKNDRDNGVERRKVYIRKSYWQSFKLVFDMKGNWLEVEGDDYGRTPVPASVLALLPQGVADALSRSYPSVPVTSVEKKLSGYKIELAGDIELYFDRDGRLQGIDDDSNVDNPGNGNNPGNGSNPSNPGNDYPNAGNLPQLAKSFLAQHYPNGYVKKVERKARPDRDGKMYEVDLTNGTEIDFTADGQWIKVDGDERPLPQSVVDLLPSNVRQDLQRRFRGATVSSIKKTRSGYKVEVLVRGDDVEVYYDARGNFQRIDD